MPDRHKSKPKAVRFPDGLLARVEAAAARDGVAVNAFIVRAVELAIEAPVGAGSPAYVHEGHTLEGLGVHYSPAAWRSETGGYVGHADWRDQYGMGTRSYCGHKHFSEAEALECITTLHEER